MAGIQPINTGWEARATRSCDGQRPPLQWGGSAFQLFARHRPNIWNVPPHAAESLNDGYDQNREKSQVYQHPNNPQENGKQDADGWNRGQNSVRHGIYDPEKKPGAAEDN